MDATFERTGEEGILSFCMQTKTGNVIINLKSATYRV